MERPKRSNYPVGIVGTDMYCNQLELYVDNLLKSQQPKRKQDCTCSLRDMAEDDPSISCEQCEQPKEELTASDRGETDDDFFIHGDCEGN